MKHFVFDLDGTLVDSLPGIAEGVNRALRLLGLPEHPQEAVRGMIGRGAANLCAAAIGYADQSLAPQEELEAVHNAFRREYPKCWQGPATQPYPGIPEMLRELVAAGGHLALLSNKPHEVTEPMIQQLFPDIPFEPIMGFSGRFPRKPAPDALLHIAGLHGISPQQLCLIGDSLYDARTAQNASSALVLVAWGYAKTDELAAWGAPLCHNTEELRLRLLQALNEA